MRRGKKDGLLKWNALGWLALAFVVAAYLLLTIVFAVKAVTDPEPE